MKENQKTKKTTILDLQAEFPASKGFSTTNLFYMKKWFLFYVTYGRFEKVQQVAGELPDARFRSLGKGQKAPLLQKSSNLLENLLFPVFSV